MMRRIQVVSWLMSFMAIGICASAGRAEEDSRNVSQLLDVLKSDSDVFEKAMACRTLGTRGTVEAVEPLADSLSDPQLAAYARTALEAIPGDESAQALRGAAERLQGDLQIGVIGSLGKRRDADAVPLLQSLLSSDQQKVAAAAARALGKVGTTAAAEALGAGLDSATLPTQIASAWGLLDCAQQAFQRGDKAAALQWTETVRTTQQLPPAVTAAASEAAIVLQGAESQLLRELLGSNKDDEFRTGLAAARRLQADGGKALVATLTEAAPQRQVLLLHALRDLADPETLTQVLEAAGGTSAEVRAAAMSALSVFSDKQAVEILLQGLADADDAVQLAARDALGQVPDSNLDSAIVALLEQRDAATLPHLVDVSEQRQIQAAAPALFELAQSTDDELRESAIVALGATIAEQDLPQLIELAERAAGDDRDAAARSLTVACARLPRGICATAFSDAIAKAELDDQVFFLQQLTVMGGEAALRTVAEYARSSEDALQDESTRLLGTWPTSDVAEELAKLAGELDNGKYQTRALRGLIRVARQLDLSPAGRIEVCRQALALADRDDERKLVLEVLRRHPSPEGLVVAASLLKPPTTRDAAFAALTDISQRTTPREPNATAEALHRSLILATSEVQKAALQRMLDEARQGRRQREAAQGFVPLFDGSSFAGWHGNLDYFRIEDEEVVAGTLKQRIPQNEFLRTDKRYDDFELRLQFKLIGQKPNAGVQIRTQEISGDHEVSGYQADLGPGWWGCLYDESRRRKVLAGPPADERGDPVRENEWNDYRILCEGKRIRLWVNGVLTVDYVEADPDIPLEGVICLQVHSGDPMEARYREIRLKELD